MMRLPFVLLGFAASLLISTVHATELNIDWPPGVAGAYSLTGSNLKKPATQSGTYAVEDHKNIRLVGPGFDYTFVPEDGKLRFPYQSPNGSNGTRFNPATNTFSFITVDVQFDVKNCDQDLSLDGSPLSKAGDPTSLPRKLIYGNHLLRYSSHPPITFSVDPKSVITLQNALNGISAHESTLTIQAQPLELNTVSSRWQLQGWNRGSASGAKTVALLPGGYSFRSFGTPAGTAGFFISDDGLLALVTDGPYQEFITLTDPKTGSLGTLSIPDGQTKYTARIQKEKLDRDLHDKSLLATAKAKWKMDFSLEDQLKFRDFAEQQISYPLELPADIGPATLKLLAFTDSRVRAVPFQISDGRIHFRADLPQGGRRTFRLVSGSQNQDIPASAAETPALEPTANPHEAILGNSLLLVKVPAGHQDFPGGKPFSQAPPPILGISRKPQPEPSMVVESFVAPDSLTVQSIDTDFIETGPLFCIYQVSYQLSQGKSYAVTLELRANESHVYIAESATGFTPNDQAGIRFDYGKGYLDPDRRLVASNGTGYETYSGDYGKKAGDDGKLNYCLGLYTPNSLGTMRATAFYREDGTDALLLAINRPRDWQTFTRAVWSSAGAVENLRFYDQTENKYFTAGLAGPKRFWVLGLIPRSEVVLSVPPGIHALPAGPDVRLLNQLSDWSLDSYKDRLADWPERLDATPFDDKNVFSEGSPGQLTFDEYTSKYFTRSSFFQWILNDSWDYSGEVGPVSFRGMWGRFGDYAVSRASWTPEQREQARQVLLFYADSSEGDANLPHHSMLAGHPNFIMDVETVLPLAAAAFPSHPRAKMWRDSFMQYYKEWLDTYERKDVPELNTRGGRWSENIAAYVGQCFVGLQISQQCLKAYDGTSLGKNPQLLTLIRWMRDAFMSPHDGVRMVPPQGAHSDGFSPGGRLSNAFFMVCNELAADDPQLAGEMRWIETNGKEGQKPYIRSALYTDYGPVFHYDFGGPRESYAHMQNIFGMNYRWGNAGIVYYGAKNKAWSFNTMETNGDQFTWNEVSAFNVKGKGLTPGPTDQLLYDFDFAQFYRQPGQEGDAYRARGLMLLRDDYLVLSDEVRDATVPGTFNWVTVYDLPQIYQLKPGAPGVDKISRDPQPPRPGALDRVGKVRSYSGKGDFLTVVAPSPVKAEPTPFGATVDGEYVFASQKSLDFHDGPASFTGNYGYARANQLALFQGTRIALDGFALHREGGDFGISASIDGNHLVGRFVGRSGGKVFVSLPPRFNMAKAAATINGQAIPITVERDSIVFSIDIAQRDGMKSYEIHFAN